MEAATQTNERLAALTAAGVSVWLDQISRDLITSGELERLVHEDSLRGVTSNPAIFEKAIAHSSDYDDQMRELFARDLNAREVYEEIAIKDVQSACDVLRQVWDETNGGDGFVSLEVEPAFAHDSDKTLAQARDFWKRVDRPNLFIKIPGTDEGIPAIEAALTEGININITLLFGVEPYERVMEAYVKAMEARRANGDSLDVASVASFFVSRVDTEVDKRLEELDRRDLRGKAAVANAREAYKRFLKVFRGERFAELAEAGCPVQRPLWASTGVKDPEYPETKYVATLVGRDTVNTMPLKTLEACAAELEVEPDTAEIDPSGDLAELADAGIDMDDVTDQLLREGIDKFVEPFDALVESIEANREQLAAKR
jgi:transaldolase